MKKRIFAVPAAAILVMGCLVSCGGSAYVKTASNYTKKSKIASANATAKMINTACNQALVELDDMGVKIIIDGWQDYNISKKEDHEAQWEDVVERMKVYTDDVEKTKFSVYIKDGAAIMSVVESDYYGTYPSYLTVTNYDSEMGKKPGVNDAKKCVTNKYNQEHPSDRI